MEADPVRVGNAVVRRRNRLAVAVHDLLFPPAADRRGRADVRVRKAGQEVDGARGVKTSINDLLQIKNNRLKPDLKTFFQFQIKPSVKAG